MSCDGNEAVVGLYDADDDLIRGTEEDGVARIRVYRPPSTVLVMGRGSKIHLEVNCEECASRGIPILRRAGGGCSVVLDPGQLVVSLSQAVAGIGDNNLHFARISKWMIAGLSEAGVPGVRQEGISDLVLGDRKIGGSCLYRRKGLLFYSTTILFEPDMDVMAACLKHPPREPAYRAGRSHRDFVMGVGGIAGADIGAFGILLEKALASRRSAI